MYPLLESIRLKDNRLFNLEYHQERMDRALKELFPLAEKIDLASVYFYSGRLQIGFI